MTISDIVLEARALCDADTTTYIAADMLRRVNAAYEEIIAKLIVRRGGWRFDDSNYTDLPIGTTTLVASQNDYSFSSAYLNILSVQVLDNASIWHPLDSIDRRDINVPMEEYKKNDGLPDSYEKMGDSIFLYPAPAAASCTLASGLRVNFQRTASVFTSAEVTTGTKVPGFASPYHVLLAYKAAIPYCMSYKQDRVALYEKKVMELEKGLLTFEANREKDVPNNLTMENISFR